MFNLPTVLSICPNTFNKPLCIDIVLPIIRRSNCKIPWVIRGGQLSGACSERFRGEGGLGGLKVVVVRIPHLSSFTGRELRQMREDPVKWGGGGANFLCMRGPFPPCLKSWCGTCYHFHPLDRFIMGGNMVREGED